MDLIGAQQHHSQVAERAWDRIPGESGKAFRAFCLFRDGGPSRTYENVAEVLRCTSSNIRRWSRKWAWVERARQYDIYIDRIELEALNRGRIAMKKRMAEQGTAMQSVAEEGLVELQQRMKRKKRPVQLTPSDIAKLAEVGGKLERYGRGDDEEGPGILEIRVRIEDPPPENAEDLAAAEAAVESALRGR